MTQLHFTTCTSCGKITSYENKRSWYNATAKLRKTGILRCMVCAGKEGREASDKTIPGRPIGSKTSPEKLIHYSRPGAGKRLNESLSHEQRLQGIATRYGFSTYEEYESTLSDKHLYKKEVLRITKQQDISILENYDKLRGACGVEGAHQLDHIYSIHKGFTNGVSPSVIGSIDNLQIIPWEENRKKGHK